MTVRRVGRRSPNYGPPALPTPPTPLDPRGNHGARQPDADTGRHGRIGRRLHHASLLIGDDGVAAIQNGHGTQRPQPRRQRLQRHNRAVCSRACTPRANACCDVSSSRLRMRTNRARGSPARNPVAAVARRPRAPLRRECTNPASRCGASSSRFLSRINRARGSPARNRPSNPSSNACQSRPMRRATRFAARSAPCVWRRRATRSAENGQPATPAVVPRTPHPE